jgi:N-acetylglucosamine-6-phosphate deacetylase
LFASVISDGYHLPPAVVKSIVRAKSPRRVLITCDAGPLAGSPPGKYRDWGTELEVLPGGKIVVSGTPFLAGSGHFTDTCVAGMVRMAGVSLTEAIEMATSRPRELMGLPTCGLEVGCPADVVEFEWDGCEMKVIATH